MFVVSDDNSVLDIKGSDFVTGKSALCIKGSSTIINVEKTSMKPGNGTIVQLMDTEESGMNVSAFHVPVGVEDTAMPERDLSTVCPHGGRDPQLHRLPAGGQPLQLHHQHPGLPEQ